MIDDVETIQKKLRIISESLKQVKEEPVKQQEEPKVQPKTEGTQLFM